MVSLKRTPSKVLLLMLLLLLLLMLMLDIVGPPHFIVIAVRCFQYLPGARLAGIQRIERRAVEAVYTAADY